jgi:hypothetical protein
MRARPLYSTALVTVLLALAPTGASAAEEAAVPPEAPAPEATPAPSTGWVPQEPAAEGAGSGNAPTQRGSSLGSGGSSNPAPSTSEPAPAPEPPPAPTPTTSYYEQEAPTPTVSGETTPATEADFAPAPAPSPEPAPKPEPENVVPPAIGSADAVERSTSGVAGEFAASSAAVEQVASTVTEDSGGLPWLALILCGLVLIYAGARVLLGPVEPEFFRSGRFHFVRRLFPGS